MKDLDCTYHEKKFSDIFDKDKFANSYSVHQAIDADDAENVMDFSELGKNTVTIDMEPDRFKCQLSEYSLAQPQATREYMNVLPEYIADKEAIQAELEK